MRIAKTTCEIRDMTAEYAVYAVSEGLSRGRTFKEAAHPYRSDFERDRDRIIHCSAFRRLEGKTQVFTPGLDDYYRTRLTHSIEVAQIGRTIAKALRLNANLTEAICLAHDLGHPPFGHAGEEALNDLMAEFDGFEHNRQALRVVDLLEHPYPDFRGLNLMYETRLGLAKHRSTYDKPDDQTFAERNCSLEGQVADIADRIAYNCHDLEDGMRAGLIDGGQLKKVGLFAAAQGRILAQSIKDRTIQRTRTAKAIIDKLVSDCIDASKKVITDKDIKSVEDAYARAENLIVLSAASEAELAELEGFLLENFYRHKSLLETGRKVKAWLGELFERLCKEPKLMPGYFQKLADEEGLQRTVCDYIAGMTDRYCLNLLERDIK
jgi:dGTPase